MNHLTRLGSALLLGVVVTGCATDNAMGPDDALRPSLAVIVDLATGLGFVGKGDVQLIYGWNNKALQEFATTVAFRISSSTETVSTWTCSFVNNGGNTVTNNRNRAVTTTTQGLLSRIARDNSKGRDGPITGFILDGFDGPPTVVVGDVEGQVLYSCPGNGGTYDNNLVTVTNVLGGGLQVQAGTPSSAWVDLPPTP